MKKNNLFFLLLLLTGFSLTAQNIDGIVKQYFSKNAGIAEIGYSSKDASELQITDIVPSLNPQIQHVYVQQLHQGIPIENGRYKLTLNKGKVTWSINQFIGELDVKSKTAKGNLTPEAAIMKVVNKHNLQIPQRLQASSISLNKLVYMDSGISQEPINADKVYYYTNDQLYLAWKVSLYQSDAAHWWNTIVDASSGTILHEEDWVVTCNFDDPNSETHNHIADHVVNSKSNTSINNTSTSAYDFVGGGFYNVYPLGIESPNHGNRTTVSDPADATASPFGWHDTNGSSGAEYTITRGNNVWAQDDINGNNGTGSSPNGGSNLVFDYPINFSQQPSQYINASVTNLFYWNNIMHDVWYQYGFNEASGNFQENNYGRGGSGSDSVNADAQDGSGTNNANFATPPDGYNPRMQMFLWSTTNPETDGDFDNGIIAHEYGHGISTRLVGGPGTNALGGSEQMGEGWSDWFGIVMTIRPGDTRATPRGVGTFALGQPTNGAGIRPTRYSPDFAVNSTTYSDIDGLAVPHGVGYAFATILWDMTWDLIDLEGFDADQYNGTGGNNIAMALVTEGLKNTANNPGFVSGRDGILQADQDLYGGQYNCLIWDAFARRGVGVDAVENSNGGTNTNSDQVVSFTSGCSGPPPPDTCNDTATSFPYSESFENTLGLWSQATGDDFDWTVNSGGTPSNNTGPSGAFEGNFYVYVEASSPNYAGKTTILNSPCFDFAGVSNPEANFHYQMTGNAVGTVRLEARLNSEQTWTQLWSVSGSQGANWIEATIDLSAYQGDNVQLRFRATTADSWQGDIAIDAFNISQAAATDTQAPSVPANLLVTGVTTNTVNLSWSASTDNVAVTGYDVFRGSTNIATVTATNYQDTGLAQGTTYQYSVRARDEAGNVSASSNTVSATTDTTPPSDGCTGGISSFPYTESFESNFGLWTQASGDDLNWTRDANGTPSNGTGPSSGSNGSFYIYVEASGNGTGYPNKQAIINSPCYDLSNETEATFSFKYHMYGANDMGTIALEASTDNGNNWTSIWNESGNKGNSWQTATIDLAAYVGGSVQLRFNRVTGSTWQADIAIDDVRLTGTSSGGGDDTTVTLTMNFDNYPEETSWEIQNSAGTVVASGGTYGSQSDGSTLNINVDLPAGCYSLVMRDSYGDGMCCSYGNGSYALTDGSTTLASGGSFQSTDTTNFCVGGATSLTNFNTTTSISESAIQFKVSPNPVEERLNISLIGLEAQSYRIMNMLGQEVLKGLFTKSIDVSKLDNGMYLLEVQIGSKTKLERFIKQ